MYAGDYMQKMIANLATTAGAGLIANSSTSTSQGASPIPGMIGTLERLLYFHLIEILRLTLNILILLMVLKYIALITFGLILNQLVLWLKIFFRCQNINMQCIQLI